MIKWVEEKSFGFARADGVDIFVHCGAIRGMKPMRQGDVVVMNVKVDEMSRGRAKAKEAWQQDDWLAEGARRAAERAAKKARQTAEETARLARLAEKENEEARRQAEAAAARMPVERRSKGHQA